MTRFRAIAALMCSAAFPLLASLPAPLWAQERVSVALAIPAQPLPQALSALASRMGLQFFYSGEAGYNLTSAPLTGTLSLEQALERIVAGTGATARRLGDNAITLTVPGETLPGRSGQLPGGADEVMLGTVRVMAGQTGRDIAFTTAGSASFISADDVQRTLGASPSEIFRGMPGVLSGDARNSAAVDVNIRGMQGQGRVPVSVDGATQETTVYHGYNGSTARSYLDPDFIGEMTVERGARVSADSTGANGGMVRVNTIRADDLLDPGQRLAFRLRSSTIGNGTNGTPVGAPGGMQAGDGNGLVFADRGMDRPGLLDVNGGSASVVAAARLPFVDLVLGYAHRRRGNYFAGASGSDGARGELLPNQYGNPVWTNIGLTNYRLGEEVLNTAQESTSLLAKLEFDLGEDQELTLGFSRYESSFGHQLATQMWGPGYQGHLSTLDLDTYTLRYRFSPSDNPLLNLSLNGFYNTADNRLNTSYYVAWAGFLAPQPVWTGAERQGLTLSNTSEFSGDWGGLSLTYGVGWQQERVGLPRGVTQDAYTAIGGTSPARVGRRTEWNAFLSSEYRPREGIVADFGLRWQRFNTLDQGVMDPFAQPLPDYEREAEGWSATAGLMYEPQPGLEIYGRLGSVIRAPSVFESLQTFSFFMPVDVNAIRPERANSIEIGVNSRRSDVFAPGDSLQLHGAVFANRVDGYITRGMMPNGTMSNGNTRYQLARVNLDFAEMAGVEMTARYDTERWFTSLSWNHYVHSNFCLPQEADPTYGRCGAGGTYNSFSLQMVPPRDTVSLEAGVTLLDGALTLGGRYTYIGARLAEGMGNGLDPAYAGNNINASSWRPYGVLDLNASYRINADARFDLMIDNVFDRHYLDALDVSLLPAPGRTLRAMLTMDF